MPPQQPYGVPQPPAPAGGGKKTGLIIGAVAVVAAIAVGAYFLIGGNGSSSGSDIADDGPHKLTTPTRVLDGSYKKSATDDSGGFSKEDLKDAEKHGVKNAQDADATYQSGDKSNPLSMKALKFMGVYGEIEDPEAVVDAMFAEMKEKSAKDDDGELVGSPQKFEPSALDNAVMKCQEAKVNNEDSSGASGPKEIHMAVCIWGDHSTLGVVMPVDYATMAAGKPADLSGAADVSAKFRKDVRVKSS
ncbi:hypothetical protein GCM10020256_51650 [Streptomyces thermocoprophilus]